MGVYTLDRDPYKEASFKDAYGLDAKIASTVILDDNKDYVSAECTFNSRYRLKEIFKEGSDNSTDKVIYTDGVGNETKEFDKYIDAEEHLVDVMKG